LVGDHSGIIPLEFGQIPISSLGEVVHMVQSKIVTPKAGSILTTGATGTV